MRLQGEPLEERRVLATNVSVSGATVVLSDNFNDNSINTSLWSTLAPAGTAPAETGNRMQLINRGYLNTVSNFNPTTVGGLHITGRWTFGDVDDFMQVLTRSSGVNAGGAFETTTGLEFAGNFFADLTIQTRVGGSPTMLATGSLPGGRIAAGDVYDFEIFDDGFNAGFKMTEVSNPTNTLTIKATSTLTNATNKVTFHTREPPYAQAPSFLDDVVITTGLKLNVTADAGVANNASLKRSGSELVIADSSGSPVPVGAAANALLANTFTGVMNLKTVNFASIDINLGDNDDLLTLDLTGGDFIQSGGVSYAGGGGVDALAISGGSQGDVVYNYTNASDGSIVMSNFGKVNYTGLAPITNTGTSDSVAFYLPATASNVTLGDDGVSGNGLSRLSSSPATFEQTTFRAASGSISIYSGHANDVLNVEALPDVATSLFFGRETSSFQSIHFNGALSLGPSPYLVAHAKSITASAAVQVSTLNQLVFAADSIDLDPACSISATTAFLSPTWGASTRPIQLGGTEVAGALCLNDAELDCLSSNWITISTLDSGGSGSLSVASDITRTSVTSLALVGSSVLLNGGRIDSAGGSLLLYSNAGPGSVQPSTSGIDLNLGTAAVTFNSASQVEFAIGGATVDTQYSQLNVVGKVSLGGIRLKLTGAYVPGGSDTFVLINNDDSDPIVGTFNGLPEGSIVTINGIQKKLSYIGGDGNDVVLKAPELVPPTVASTNPSFVSSGTLATGATSLAVQFSENVLNVGISNLVSFWPGEGNANDAVGANHGTLVGATIGAGRIGSGFVLDGVNDFVNFPASPSLDFGTGDFTVGVWVNFASTTGEQVIMEKYVERMGAGTTGWSLTKLGNNAIRLALPSGVFIDSPVQSGLVGNWTHFTVQRSSGIMVISRDGLGIAGGAFSGTLNSTSSLKLGHRGNPSDTPGSLDNGGYFLNGRIDEPEVYNRTLTSSELAAMISRTTARPANSNFVLQSQGADGLLGSADDVVIPLGASYSPNVATLSFAGLSEGVYRLTVKDAIVDPAGNKLDGDANGTAGGNWVRDFVVLGSAAPAFQDQANFSTQGVFYFANADFNGDGDLDIAILNAYSHTVAWYYGDGAGGFTAGGSIATGLAPFSIVAGNFGGSALPDLAVSDTNTGNVTVFVNDGTGFTAGPTTSVGAGLRELVVGDFNGDSFADLAVAKNGPNISVLLGNGTGAFTVSSYPTTGNDFFGLVVADMNGDGKSDLVASAYTSNSISVLLGSGTGTFATSATRALGAGGAAYAVAVGDFNGDGRPDVAASVISAGTVVILLGDGAGSFAAQSSSVTVGGSYPYYTRTADMNADGILDLVVSSYDTGLIKIFAGNGGGGFALSRTLSYSTPYPIAIVDVDRDFRPDILVGNFDGGTARLYRNVSSYNYIAFDSANHLTLDTVLLGQHAGSLIQGPNNAFDGLGRLLVNGAPVLPLSASLVDSYRTGQTTPVSMSGLQVSREITVPNTGSQDFARTVDSFHNATASPITRTIKIVGNLGSDAATTVFNTSNGDTTVETTDQWIGTDDADGTGTPAIVHYIHGPKGLAPTAVEVIGDNIYWTYDITVQPGETLQLAHFTILNNTRAGAEADAAALVTGSGFGGEAAAFLSGSEIAALANFQFNTSPTFTSASSVNVPENSNVVLNVTATDAEQSPAQITYSISGGADRGKFGISSSGFLLFLQQPDFETKLDADQDNVYLVEVTADDGQGGTTSQLIAVTVIDVSHTVTVERLSDGGEGAGFATFVVKIADSAAVPLDISYSLTGSALNGTDYSDQLHGVAHFEPGSVSVTISLQVFNDQIVESQESIELKVTGTGNPDYVIAANSDSATVYIADNDQAFFYVTSATANEADGSITFTVTLNRPIDIDFDIELVFEEYTATAGVDFDATSRHVHFAALSTTSQTVTVPIVNDDIVDGNEFFYSRFGATSSFGNRSIGWSDLGTHTITDDDRARITFEQLPGGGETAGSVAFRINSTAALDVPLVFQFNHFGISATAGDDYGPGPRYVTLDALSTSQEFTVDVVDDDLSEGTETFFASVFGDFYVLMQFDPHNLTFGDLFVYAEIADNDVDLKVTKTSSADTVVPGSGPGNLFYTIRVANVGLTPATNLHLSELLTYPAGVTVDYVQSTRGGIYESVLYHEFDWALGTLAPGETETLTVSLTVDATTPFGSTISDTAAISSVDQVLIEDEDNSATLAVPVLSPTVSVEMRHDGAEQGGPATFRFSIDRVLYTDLTIGYALSGTATPGDDYATLTDPIVIPAGSVYVDVTFSVVNDGLVESLETLKIDLDLAEGLTAGTASATASIFDANTATVQLSRPIVDEDAGTVTFEVYANSRIDIPLTFDLTYYSQGATAGEDYSPNVYSVTLAAGTLATTFTVPLLGDDLSEGYEYFEVVMSYTAATQAALEARRVNIGQSGFATLVDNDVDLKLTKTANVTSVVPGSGEENVVFTVTVQNTGLTTTTGISVSDIASFPTGVSIARVEHSVGSAPGATWDIGSLAPGASATMTIYVTVSNAARVGDDIDNSASIASALPNRINTEDDYASASVHITGGKLSIAKLNDGKEGESNAKFRISIDRVAANDLYVNYNRGGLTTASAGIDYTGAAGTVVIPAGQTYADIEVQVLNDNIVEADELLQLLISVENPDFHIDGPASATATIVSEDVATFTIDDATFHEGDGTVSFTVRSSNPIDRTFDLQFVYGGSIGVDYIADLAGVGFSASQTSKTVTIRIVDDLLIEPAEQFTIGMLLDDETVAALSPRVLNVVDTGTFTIVDNDYDLQVTKTASVASVVPGAGTNAVVYTITVTNTGYIGVEGVRLADVFNLPAGVTIGDISVSTSEYVRTVSGVSSTFNIAAQSSFTLTVGVNVSASAPGGTFISDTATLTAGLEHDVNGGNNSASLSTPINYNIDFGNAPSSYKTRLADNGPRHTMSTGLKLGATVAGDADGAPNTTPADNDGVALPTTIYSQLDAKFVITASAAGKLDAWIDFNRNGLFDANEKIASGLDVAAGPNTLVIDVPASALLGATYARFRLSSAGVSLPTGAAPDGEVEDYALSIGTFASSTAQVIDDPENPGHGVLVLYGQAKDDLIYVHPKQGQPGQVEVQLFPQGPITTYAAASFERIVAFGLAGNDLIEVRDVSYPTKLYGDAGNDRLFGGLGPNWLSGGDGNDRLFGNVNDDTFVGGAGNDQFTGGGGFDKIVETGSGAFVVTNTSLKIGSATDTWTDIDAVDLTGGGSADTFTLTNVSLAVALHGAGGNDTVAVTGSGNFVLTNSLLTLNAASYLLDSIEIAKLTGGSSADSFNVSGWTGQGTFAGAGGTDTLVASGSTSYALSNTALARNGLPTLTLKDLEVANLTGNAGGGTTFNVSGWTKSGSLAGLGNNNKLVVTENASFTLTDAALTRTAGNVKLNLSGIDQAELTGGTGANVLHAAGFSGRLKLDGGGGNDTLTGGSGTSLLLGGAGNDLLNAGLGRAILIGGVGADKLTGGASDDLLIDGTTAFDANAAALVAILAEWASGSSYDDRVSHLTGTAGGLNAGFFLTGANVVHDSNVDTLAGGAGLDLFFAKQTNPNKDTITDRDLLNEDLL